MRIYTDIKEFNKHLQELQDGLKSANADEFEQTVLQSAYNLYYNRIFDILDHPQQIGLTDKNVQTIAEKYYGEELEWNIYCTQDLASAFAAKLANTFEYMLESASQACLSKCELNLAGAEKYLKRLLKA
jgi:hypothetical protein